MKKMIILAAMLFGATVVMAETSSTESTVTEEWICIANGMLSVGGPVGSINITTIGRGATQLEAMDDADQNCSSQGLSMCTISMCHKK